MSLLFLGDENINALKGAHAWLAPSNLQDSWLLCNPDLDGLLCLALIKKLSPSARVAGFYVGEKTLVLTPEARAHVALHGLSSLRAIESDFYLMPSVGQHLTLARSAHPHLNPNALRGVNQIGQKYPFNTLVFLWRWFGMSIPSTKDKVRRNAVLRLLFYPDGALVKNVPNYRKNCEEWLKWLNMGVTYDELQAISRDPISIQIARCLYKNFSTTHLSLKFSVSSEGFVPQEADQILRWISAMSRSLELPEIQIPDLLLVENYFGQVKISEVVSEQRNMDAAQFHLRGTKIVSDALVRGSEWSVTLDGANPAFPNADRNPPGRAVELRKWVEELNLKGPCVRKKPCGADCNLRPR